MDPSADELFEPSEETVRAPMPEPVPTVQPTDVTKAPKSDTENMTVPTIAVQPDDLLSRSTARIPQLTDEMLAQAEPMTDDASHDARTVYMAPKPNHAAPENKKNTKPAKKSRTGKIVGIVCGSVVLACILGLLIFGIVLKAGDFIYPNVYVTDTLNLGGMDRQTALDAVNNEMADSYASFTLKVRLPDQVLEFTPDKTNVVMNAEAAVDEAMAYGRSCGPFRAVWNYFISCTDETKDYRVSKLELNTDYIYSTLEAVADEVETEPYPSSVSFDEQTQQLVVIVGQPERSLDVDGLYDVIYTAFEQGDFETIVWEYDEVPVEMPQLEEIFNKYCTPVEDAYYNEETRTIVDAVPGYGFDMEEVQQNMTAAEPGSKQFIPMADLEPEITKEDVEKEMFGAELFSHSTAYVNNANRTKNLTLACQAINGIILNPGDEFSFNNVVGERTAAKGYMQATVYNGGLSVPELGGGVCQVASTLYYCTLHLDLEQVHREPHMFVVDYVPKGMDATIYWGKIDYKFKNTLDFPIRILINTDNGHVNATFQGLEELDYSVQMEFVVTATYGYQELVKVDETKEPGYSQVDVTPYVGYRVETYKTILDADGNQLSKKLEATSTYSKRDKVTIVGPSEEPENPDDPFDPGLWDDPEDPGTEDPGTQDPGTDDPGTEDPGTEDPGTEDPGTEDPGTEDPGTDDPFADWGENTTPIT